MRLRVTRVLSAVIIAVMLLTFTGVSAAKSFADEVVYTARPSVNGKLHLENGRIADESGSLIQLRGISTHGLTWYPGFINQSLINQISNDWNCNMLRLPVYTDLYCEQQKDEYFRLLHDGIEYAIASDMYVLVDWHTLQEQDPNYYVDEACDFFEKISSEYKDCPNIIYEICNEPNTSANWSDIIVFSDAVIPVIRKNNPDSLIVVGTPDFDTDLGDPYMRPLDYDNVMYVLHFYTASHQDELMGSLKKAVDLGLPVFISECGISEASGDGDVDLGWAAKWFSYLNEEKISYAVWSLSDKNESSAFFVTGFDPESQITDDSLTPTGKWIRSLIKGEDPLSIARPADRITKGFWDKAYSFVIQSLGSQGVKPIRDWPMYALFALCIILLAFIIIFTITSISRKKFHTYHDIIGNDPSIKKDFKFFAARICVLISIFFTLVYLMWRVFWSVPVEYGVVAIAANIVLLLVEIIGFIESLVLFNNFLNLRDYKLPVIPDDSWPEVDVFIATYNEPCDLLERTINGCKHMKYPDRSKVHIWICDDNRRPEMRELAAKMGVGYFDRPDNKNAKAGNFNHALALTSAPYVVTFDADMIPRSEFLINTIPYFVDAYLRQKDKPEDKRIKLGLLQSPQCFYDPDVFQHALYSERRIPNEQDFFYRTIEPSRTGSNSVIYGGSNTILSREALEAVGGFYTESITEDFATGLLIESKGFVSLAIPEPLASGQTPHTFKEHIKQRTRWGRGVIVTARKVKIWTRRDLSLAQKINYWSSVSYWYSPFKNLVYLLAPLLYAVLSVPVFRCNGLELLAFWIPMFLMQDICLRVNSKSSISTKWSGIYETSVMPHLLIPILKESVGISLTKFKVTDKSKSGGRREKDIRSMMPFIILSLLSVAGLIRVLLGFTLQQIIPTLVLIFWMIRNLYFLIMSIFLVDGRDSDEEPVKVIYAENVSVDSECGKLSGVTTLMTEHNMTVFLDEAESLSIGMPCIVNLEKDDIKVQLKGVVTGIRVSKNKSARTHTIEITDFAGQENEYRQILYDRIPTLPQSLHRDLGVLRYLWYNLALRLASSARK